MKSASLNQDAMTYARNEMEKLINISNGTSALHDSIESRNLRQINQLASRLDGNDILNTYDELLERFSRETPQESAMEALSKTSPISFQRKHAERSKRHPRESGQKPKLLSSMRKLMESRLAELRSNKVQMSMKYSVVNM